MKLILASNNKNKLLEFKEILAGTGIEVIPQSEAGCHFEVDETGDTFEENAFLKAEAAMKATGLPAVSDDSGLEVDALGGAPGVHSARYTGNHDDSDLDRRLFLMKNLEGEEHRTARFVSAICCVFPNGDKIEAEGKCFGTIAFDSRGENGFGYDSIFQQEGRTFGEMTAAEKDARSHRGKAFAAFEEKLREYLKKGE